MKLSDIITSKDGSLSLTKLAASTAHINLAVAFAWITYSKGFIAEMWLIYAGAAIGHAAYDKTKAMLNARMTAEQENKT